MAKYAYNFDDPKVKKPKYTYSFEEEEETVKPEQPDGPLTLKVPFTDLKYDIGQTPVIGKPLEKVATGFSGVMGRTAAGMEKGLTLGAIDPERGTIGIPILQNVLPQTRLQILSPENGMAKQMEQQGVPKVIAENPYIGLPGELAGSTAPIGLISRGISGGVSAITGGAKTLAAGTKLANAGQKVAEGSGLLQKTGKVAGRLGHAATVGGIVGTTEDIRPGETIADNIKRGAVWGAGLQVLGEGVGAIGNATKMIDKMKAYRSLKDSLAEWAYGEGRYNSLDAAKKDIGQMISNDIKRAGGLKSVTKEQAQKMRDFIRRRDERNPLRLNRRKFLLKWLDSGKKF